MKLRKSAHLIVLFLGLGAFLAAQIMGGTVLATCCDYADRAGGHHPTQGTKCYSCERDCPQSFPWIACGIPVHALINSSVIPEIMALARKSAGSYCNARDPLTARAILALWKTHPQGIAGRCPSSDPPIFITDLALII